MFVCRLYGRDLIVLMNIFCVHVEARCWHQTLFLLILNCIYWSGASCLPWSTWIWLANLSLQLLCLHSSTWFTGRLPWWASISVGIGGLNSRQALYPLNHISSLAREKWVYIWTNMKLLCCASKRHKKIHWYNSVFIWRDCVCFYISLSQATINLLMIQLL